VSLAAVGRRVAAALSLAVLSVVVAATAARAHAELVGMSPAIDSVVAQAPSSVVLTFADALQDLGAAVIVTAPSGAHLESGAPAIAGNTATQRLLPLTEPGRYTVAYRVVSQDGHPVERQVGFTFAPAGTASSATSMPSASASVSPSAGASESPSATGSSGSGSPWWPVGVALVVVLAGGAAVHWRRRRPSD
jgi:methionine-rich copper-binding protein CopC